jgi:hypothetical protein
MLDPAGTAANLSGDKISPAGDRSSLLAAAALEILDPPRSSAALRPLGGLAVSAAPLRSPSPRHRRDGPGEQPKGKL